MLEQSQQPYILIVDDTPHNFVSFKAILKEWAQYLIFATSAGEALRQVLIYDFAVILLDVQMPDMNGFEAAKLIRAREKSSYTPIIFLSAFNQDELDINQGYALGAVDYILKPINPLILYSKIKVFVDFFTKSTLARKLQNELKERLHAEQRVGKQQRRLELAEVNRLNTIEEISSALAHELNQPLASISNYVKGCMHRLNKGNYKIDELMEALERAGQQAERAGAILHRIKNFVRKNKLYYEAVSINALITNLVLLLQDTIEENGVSLDFELCKKNMPQVFLDKVQIEQAILNLLRNGIEALKECQKCDRKLSIQTSLDNNKKSLIVNIKDNGPGIKPEHTAKIFELYYTTKSEGMGVGLSICRTVIEAHGGRINVSNNISGGACFQIVLPIYLTHPDISQDLLAFNKKKNIAIPL
jgi:signal transduction histidine kinase